MRSLSIIILCAIFDVCIVAKDIAIEATPFEPPEEYFFQWNDKFQQPQTIVTPVFSFPFEAKRGPAFGEVIILVHLGKDGRPDKLAVLCATHPFFIPSAIAGLKTAQWKNTGDKEICFYYKVTFSSEMLKPEKNQPSRANH